MPEWYVNPVIMQIKYPDAMNRSVLLIPFASACALPVLLDENAPVDNTPGQDELDYITGSNPSSIIRYGKGRI